MHVATCKYFNLIQTMLHVKIQIWFYWGSCKGRPPKASFKWVDSLCPTPDEVSALLMPNASSSDTSGLPQEPEPLPHLPAPEPKSGQSQERHGSSSLTDKLLDFPKRSHAKPLK